MNEKIKELTREILSDITRLSCLDAYSTNFLIKLREHLGHIAPYSTIQIEALQHLNTLIKIREAPATLTIFLDAPDTPPLKIEEHLKEYQNSERLEYELNFIESYGYGGGPSFPLITIKSYTSVHILEHFIKYLNTYEDISKEK